MDWDSLWGSWLGQGGSGPLFKRFEVIGSGTSFHWSGLEPTSFGADLALLPPCGTRSPSIPRLRCLLRGRSGRRGIGHVRTEYAIGSKCGGWWAELEPLSFSQHWLMQLLSPPTTRARSLATKPPPGFTATSQDRSMFPCLTAGWSRLHSRASSLSIPENQPSCSSGAEKAVRHLLYCCHTQAAWSELRSMFPFH